VEEITQTTNGVGAVASMAGVTVRTLHHYEEIGLLTPSHRTVAGYRRYTDGDLAHLQSILFYRELGLGLDEIAAALLGAQSDRAALLVEQRRLILEERDRLDRMAAALSQAISAERTGIKMSPQNMFEMFGDFDPAEHAAEAAERWPDTYAVSRQRTSRYTKEQWLEAAAESDTIAAGLAALKASGAPADGTDAMDLAERHRLSIDRWFYPCSEEIHAGLGDMYLADPRFKNYWEDRAGGLAQYVHDAIWANASR